YPLIGWWARSTAKRHLHALEAAGHTVDPERYWTPSADPDDDVFRHPAMIAEMEEKRVMRVRDRAHGIPGLAKRFPAAQPALGRVTDLARWFEPPIEDEKSAAERLLEGQRDVLERLEALRPAFARKEAV